MSMIAMLITQAGFFPNDDLSQRRTEVMDWTGDSPFTSFVTLYRALRASGFYVEASQNARRHHHRNSSSNNNNAACHRCSPTRGTRSTRRGTARYSFSTRRRATWPARPRS